MKCPYRKEVQTYKTGKEHLTNCYGKEVSFFGTRTEEHFMNCYGIDCPFYIQEQSLKNGLVIKEGCTRTKLVIREKMKSPSVESVKE